MLLIMVKCDQREKLRGPLNRREPRLDGFEHLDSKNKKQFPNKVQRQGSARRTWSKSEAELRYGDASKN